MFLWHLTLSSGRMTSVKSFLKWKCYNHYRRSDNRPKSSWFNPGLWYMIHQQYRRELHLFFIYTEICPTSYCFQLSFSVFQQFYWLKYSPSLRHNFTVQLSSLLRHGAAILDFKLRVGEDLLILWVRKLTSEGIPVDISDSYISI